MHDAGHALDSKAAAAQPCACSGGLCKLFGQHLMVVWRAMRKCNAVRRCDAASSQPLVHGCYMLHLLLRRKESGAAKRLGQWVCGNCAVRYFA